MTIFVTGGAGFIGSNFIRLWLKSNRETIVNIDKFTYAGRKDNIKDFLYNEFHILIKGSINDRPLIDELFKKFQPRAVIHFAAESHVDNSIKTPRIFIKTNIIGSFELIDSTRIYWNTLTNKKKSEFRFINISTDEIFGSLIFNDKPFKENRPYVPNNPYSASKASSNHIIRSYYTTYNLPIIITNCSNNYGPFQYPEKLIPKSIKNALNMKHIPIYGDGTQIRDWIYVEDHCRAIIKILQLGSPGESYNIGGGNELSNFYIVKKICEILDRIKPNKFNSPYYKQIRFVANRKGCDERYAVNYNKIFQKTKWTPLQNINIGLYKTVKWYVDNYEWMEK